MALKTISRMFFIQASAAAQVLAEEHARRVWGPTDAQEGHTMEIKRELSNIWLALPSGSLKSP